MKQAFIVIFILLEFNLAQALRCQDLKTLEIPTEISELPPIFDYLVVSKSQRKLLALKESSVVRSYHVSIGQKPVGAKSQDGDLKTPEGQYYIERKKSQSAYRLGLQISYPNPAQVEKAQARGVNPGSDILIHGFPLNAKERVQAEAKHFTSSDWTMGCMAVTDQEIDEIYEHTTLGTPILICP